MIYKSFKHQKTPHSTYTLSPKINTRTHLGFHISSHSYPPLHLLSLWIQI
ncbi:hypothetical protein HanIR_Chr09g0433771 [Helianthus annuus]|nr:hypothetical protein HanIR_Chr09g0433771 [Helianthus annuus]